MGDRRQLRAVFVADVNSRDHVRQFHHRRYIEPQMHLLQRDRRRKRAKRLAHFHHGVDAVAHFRSSGVREDTAVPEGARSELHRPPVPPDNPALGDQLRRLRAGLVKSVVELGIDLAVELPQRGFDLLH